MKKRVLRRYISILVVVAIIMSSVSSVIAEDSYDWKDIQKYYPYSSWAVDTGTKYSLIFLDNNNRDCMRLEIVKLLFNILEMDENKEAKSNFTDFSWLNESEKKKVALIADRGIVNGYSDGSFKPFASVTRAEFVTMLDKSDILKGKSKIKENVSFSDTKKHWAKDSIEKIAAYGIVNGKDANLFYPDDSITPQEILIIMDRLVNLGCFDSENLVDVMTNTFKCKKYGEKEKYVIEVMYSKFDEVQAFMTYNFPYKDYYNPYDWNSLATIEDIQYVTYFMMSRKTQILDTGITRQVFDDIKNSLLSSKKFGGELFTMRDLLHAIAACEKIAVKATNMGYGFDRNIMLPFLNFTNKENITEEDNEMFRIILGNTRNTLLKNTSMYFPFDIPITKYMLNYFAMQMAVTYSTYSENFDYGITKFFHRGAEFETDSSKTPYNYLEYPFILKDIPKEAYEKPYSFSDVMQVRLPIDCYYTYVKETKEIDDIAENYFDTILNIDYRTIDEAVFGYHVKQWLYHVPQSEITKYVQYVKDNEIIIEGKGAAIPGTLFIVDGTMFMKTILKFKIVSAKEMKNLLFGDMHPNLSQDVIYTKNEYEIYPDISAYRLPFTPDQIEISYSPIITGIYWNRQNYTLP